MTHPAHHTEYGGRSIISDATLGTMLARCRLNGEFVTAETLDAVAAFARRASRIGAHPEQIARTVRRALTTAAPEWLTVAALETAARRLVHHAMHALIDD